MKKIISVILSVIMIFTSVGVLADETEATAVQEVLLKIKSKITVPAELTEFSASTRTQNQKTMYDLSWNTPDYEKYVSVFCDDGGRIQSYYNDTVEYSEKMISSVSKKQIIDFATDFIKTALPEAFKAENDALFYDEASYRSLGNLRYSLEFKRLKNNIPVKDNYANVNVCVADETMHISSLNVRYNYDAEFEEEKAPSDDYVQKYKEAFPLEMVYINEYVPLADARGSNYAPKLIFRIKDNDPGYIDIASGDIIKEDSADGNTRFAGAAADKAENTLASGGSAPQLTPEEIAELEKIDNLMSVEEIEKKLKALPYLGFPGKLKLNTKSLNKDSLGDYYYRLSYSHEEKDDYRYFNVTVNAQSGEIIRVTNSGSAYSSTKTELSDYQIQLAQKKINEFLNSVCKEKLTQATLNGSSAYSWNVSSSYTRIVNNVKFIDNGISVSFDSKNNVITSFNINFSKGEFANPADAVSAESAYLNLIDYSPIEPIFILCGGKYVKAASLRKHYVTLDALNGDVINAEKFNQYNYSDIEGHWVQEAAEKLSELQVGFPGDKLEPEKEITQEELLRLWLCGIRGNHFLEYTSEGLYNYLKNQKIITEDEYLPESPTKREDAFVYLIRICDYEKVAKLKDIYKVSYEDSNDLSEDKIGYAAILGGFEIICGNGGKLRPQDKLTRAEAIIMLYKYLLKM